MPIFVSRNRGGTVVCGCNACPAVDTELSVTFSGISLCPGVSGTPNDTFACPYMGTTPAGLDFWQSEGGDNAGAYVECGDLYGVPFFYIQLSTASEGAWFIYTGTGYVSSASNQNSVCNVEPGGTAGLGGTATIDY